jgi:hypothetical protein
MPAFGHFDKVFTQWAAIFSSKFIAWGPIVAAMNTTIVRAREMSLALIVIAVVNHGHLQADLSGARPGSSGLMRLGRDLMRRAGAELTSETKSTSDERG